MNLDRFVELLETPTHSGHEDPMIAFLCRTLSGMDGVRFHVDHVGNVFAEKGDAEHRPCLVAHIDTVQSWSEARAEVGAGIITGVLPSGNRTGLGADCKTGVFVALEVFRHYEGPLMLAFFVGEEVGGVGSSEADLETLARASYFVGLDCPSGNLCSYSTGPDLFDVDSVFGRRAIGALSDCGYDRWQHHPFTDTLHLRRRVAVPCLNIGTGYYRWHSNMEFILLVDVENAIHAVTHLLNVVGPERHELPCGFANQPERSSIMVEGLSVETTLPVSADHRCLALFPWSSCA